VQRGARKSGYTRSTRAPAMLRAGVVFGGVCLSAAQNLENHLSEIDVT